MLKKRFLKLMSLAVAVLVSSSMLVPSLVLAHRPPPPPPPYRHHHDGWSSSDTWGLIGIGVLGAIIASNSRSSTRVVQDYPTYKANFVASLDDEERYIFYQMYDTEPGYRYVLSYDRDVSARRAKKIATKLYYDFNFLYIDKESKQVYFDRLEGYDD